MSGNVVEKEKRCNIGLTVEGRHGFDLFGEVINNQNDVFMAVDRRRVAGHEVNHPLVEGTDIDNRMQRRGRCSFLWGKELVIAIVFNCMDVIEKDGGPEITGT